ncbi:synaptonemal complex protein 2-like [Tyto alba]|uniref:synaptonemal complex protein 2-like n=1 Tax=Tyto alba TaxID=56313 RepID=UPI001C66BE74|nr:synaptonemal complex protein 2-like [Tyto alba]
MTITWEEKSEKRNREVNGNMAARAENYLESLLMGAFKGKGFQKISELLQEREIEPPQKYSKSLLKQLDKSLRKVLTDFFNFYLVSWFERTRAFVILINTKENKYLVLLLEDFFDTALVICKCSDEGKKEMVNLFLPELGHLVTEANACFALRQEAMRTLNSILDSVPREERKKFPLSEEMCSLTKCLAKTILEAGDYDLQVAISEALCRLMTKKWRDDFVHSWFEDDYLAEAFKEIKDREFETDCRKFLNRLNERLGNGKRVYSFPCISAFADMNEVKKPLDEKLEGFWIDFNTGSQSVTFYVDSKEGALWESVRLSKEAVRGYSLKENDGEKVVKIYMKIPATFNETEATKIKISFSAEFEILSILRKVLGDEKMMINMAEEESLCAGKQDERHEAVLPESTNPQGRTDPSNSENMETPPDDLASQHSPQLTDTVAEMVNSDVTTSTVNQQADVEDANELEKSKTSSPRMKAKPSEKPLEEPPVEESTSKTVTWEKRNRKTRSAKQKTEGRKEIYDFENSDSASHEKVAEAKRKIFGQKDSSQNQRNYETGNKNKDSNKLKRRRSSYRNHLFSESNSENTSTDQSEKSWILEPEKQSLPKSLDYARKRPGVKSKLKVLPVSSTSSGSDYQPNKNFHDASDTLSREKESFKRKDSDILSGTVVKKLKFSSWETSHLSSASHKPRKLFDSVEKEAEIQTGQEMDDSVDDEVFSKLLHEDFSDTLLITAFESLIDRLKKWFWSRYKRMETGIQNALRTSEKSFTTLLNQIHKCRLSKLETFYKIVVEELAGLEKEAQVLTEMEKDAVDYWNTQLIKLNAFCNQQTQRIQSDSALGETATFADTVQKSTGYVQYSSSSYEHSVKKAVENNVFIVASD